MSKKITHDEAREIINSILLDIVGLPEVEKLLNYITQQERLDKARLEVFNEQEVIIKKQEKLLELYRKLVNVYEHRFDYSASVSLIKELKNEIKELENESSNNRFNKYRC